MNFLDHVYRLQCCLFPDADPDSSACRGRIHTYADTLVGELRILIVTIGVRFVFGLGIVLFRANVFVSLKHGRPLRTQSLARVFTEWSDLVAAAARVHNFAVIPIVASRYPLWEDRLDEGPDRSSGWVRDWFSTKNARPSAPPCWTPSPTCIPKMPGDRNCPCSVAVAMTGVLRVCCCTHGGGAASP